jgi:hypothetical protein
MSFIMAVNSFFCVPGQGAWTVPARHPRRAWQSGGESQSGVSAGTPFSKRICVGIVYNRAHEAESSSISRSCNSRGCENGEFCRTVVWSLGIVTAPVQATDDRQALGGGRAGNSGRHSRAFLQGKEFMKSLAANG